MMLYLFILLTVGLTTEMHNDSKRTDEKRLILMFLYLPLFSQREDNVTLDVGENINGNKVSSKKFKKQGLLLETGQFTYMKWISSHPIKIDVQLLFDKAFIHESFYPI